MLTHRATPRSVGYNTNKIMSEFEKSPLNLGQKPLAIKSAEWDGHNLSFELK